MVLCFLLGIMGIRVPSDMGLRSMRVSHNEEIRLRRGPVDNAIVVARYEDTQATVSSQSSGKESTIGNIPTRTMAPSDSFSSGDRNEGGDEIQFIDLAVDEETYEVEVDADSSLARAAVALEAEKYTVKGFLKNKAMKDGHYAGPRLSKREKYLPPSTTKQKRGTRLIKMSASALRSASNRVSLVSKKLDQMTYLQIMAAGAISRTMAQTIMHPANTFKTMLQLKRDSNVPITNQLTPERLLRGADAQFFMSLPHGAFYFFVIDQVKTKVSKVIPKAYENLSDFAASAISTVVCSIVSTPQMVLTDRLMAGVYPNFPVALRQILKQEGVKGFYAGWRSGLAQKIPSYGLTWMFFQQLKRAHESFFDAKPSAETNFFLGALAAAGGTTVMIPMDTVKTRLVIQGAANGASGAAYTGVRNCFVRILREEGVGAFYRALPPRLGSVVPMIAIQFGTYEIIKARLQEYNSQTRIEGAIAKKQAARAAKRARAERRKLGVEKGHEGTPSVQTSASPF